MSCAGIQTTVNFYTMREADLTSELTNIMFDITQASKDSSKLVRQTSDKRNAVKDQYGYGTEAYDKDGYDNAMAEIQDEYELQLSEITTWESELETQKETKETEIQATASFKESFQSALKQNIATDFKYGDSSG